MDEVLKFLRDSKVFYVATVDGNLPRVRPFGLVMIYDGKLCFCTNNQKDVYKQMQANPNIEISATSPDGMEWIRLRGKAVFNTTRESKKAALEVSPSLRDIYSEDDDIFETFYIDQAEATFADMKGNSRTVKL